MVSTLLPVRRPWAPFMVLALAATAIGGCNCGTRALVTHGPHIVVEPNPINVTNGIVGQATHVTLHVNNKGTADLKLTKNPYIVDATAGIQFGLANVLVNDCTGKARTGDLLTIGAGMCAELELGYQASMNGTFTAKLRFDSNDPKQQPYDVPITIAALTPHIKACAFDGSTMLGCNTDGQPLNLSFGMMGVPVGTSVTRTIQLVSDGTTAVTVNEMKLQGDPDYSTSPQWETWPGANMAPGQMQSFTLTFTPTIGGPRQGTLTFGTSDPKNSPLVVNILGQGDGPALCFCIGASQQGCEFSSPTVAFGQVGVNSTSTLNIYLNSCGTQPLTFTSASLASGAPEFAAMNLPTANMTLPPGMTLTVPVTFTPPAAQPYSGRIVMQTADGERPFFDLTGTGVNSGCNIQVASTTLDFGQVATGITASRDYVLANTGTEACTFPKAPAITAGSPLFAIGSSPLGNLLPSHTAKITVTYTPTAMSGTDMGTMEVYYSAATAGAQTQTLDVNLKGEPVANPTCKLTALPAANSIFGRTLNFGEVGLNRPKTLPIVFQNVGSAPCGIGQATINMGIPLPGFGGGSAFTISKQPSSPLAPGDTTTVEVQFIATAEMTYGSPLPGFGGMGGGFGPSVQVNTTDKVSFDGSTCGSGFPPSPGSPGCVAWALSGQGVESTIQVLPSDLDFGEVTLGCNSPQKNVTIYNVGMSTIHITGFSVDPMPPPTIFTVIAPPASTSRPISLAPGANMTIQVKYTPTMTGIQTGTLYIQSDAVPGSTGTGSNMSNPYITVSLTGTGTTDSQQTDTFTQLDHPVADVLWVIDQDSNSMADKQQAISTNAQAFIQAAEAAHTDYHLGVVSSFLGMSEKSSNYPNVMVNPGQLFNVSAPQLWVQSSDPNPVQEFQQNALIGVTGDATGSETGLEAMFRALSDPLINGANKGFLRDEARLIVISISDDDDVSSKSADFYAAFLQSLKPNNPQDVVFDTVDGDLPNGCTNGVDGDPPNRYAVVSNATGGKLYSICYGQYAQIAADLSLGSFGGRTHFVLSRPCDPSTLTVTVTGTNGQTVMQTLGTDYTFDSGRNSIDFKTAPAPGSTITASYDALCL